MFANGCGECYRELVHDGPRVEMKHTGTVVELQLTKRPGSIRYRFEGDMVKMIRDFFRLKRELQEEFKEKFIDYLQGYMNKIHPHARPLPRALDECLFVECASEEEEGDVTAQSLDPNSQHDPTILLDGKTYRYTTGVDPSGFFHGRGESNPHHGCYRRRISPGDVTVNCSRWLHPELVHDRWGRVIFDPHASWLASWEDPVTRRLKYIFIPNNTEQSQTKHRIKYDSAFELSKTIENIRLDYGSILHHRTQTMQQDAKILQVALVIYMVDHFSIRIGNPQETRTFGACSLLKEHIRLLQNDEMILCFPGKDSVQYSRRHRIHPDVYQKLRQLLTAATKEGRIFPLANPGDVNRYLQQFGDFSIKSFRTMNACLLCNSALQNGSSQSSSREKLIVYQKACAHVARMCNHQRKSPHGVLTYSVATGKGNYIDPRIVMSYCRRVGMEVRQCYSKSLLEKNVWAQTEKSPWDVYY